MDGDAPLVVWRVLGVAGGLLALDVLYGEVEALDERRVRQAGHDAGNDLAERVKALLCYDK